MAIDIRAEFGASHAFDLRVRGPMTITAGFNWITAKMPGFLDADKLALSVIK